MFFPYALLTNAVSIDLTKTCLPMCKKKDLGFKNKSENTVYRTIVEQVIIPKTFG